MYQRKSLLALTVAFLALLPIFGEAATYLESGVSCKHKKYIVNLHNKCRRQVAQGVLSGQPKASNMLTLVWDDDLARVAQGWADNMKFKHNKGRKDGRFKVGENIYTSWSTSSDRKPDWGQAINSWFDEYKLYTYQPCVADPATGHYTQMIWANTMYVGCGFTLYKENGVLNKLYVCDYGPTGNMLGQHPYNVGAGCDNLCCKSQCGKRYGNQCSRRR